MNILGPNQLHIPPLDSGTLPQTYNHEGIEYILQTEYYLSTYISH